MILNAFAVDCSPRNFETWRKKIFQEFLFKKKLYIHWEHFLYEQHSALSSDHTKIREKTTFPLVHSTIKIFNLLCYIFGRLNCEIKPPMSRSISSDCCTRFETEHSPIKYFWMCYLRNSDFYMKAAQCNLKSKNTKFSWEKIILLKNTHQLISSRREPNQLHQSMQEHAHAFWAKNVATHMTFLADLSLGQL